MLARWIVRCLAALGLAHAAHAEEIGTVGNPRWSIAIHGGAGTMSRERMTEAREAEYEAALAAALDAGATVLAGGWECARRGRGGGGGVIVAAPDGTTVFSFNTPGMYRGRADSAGLRETAIFGGN